MVMASFQPADKLFNRTFIGLLAAQFLAAFNDQAINASAMFFAIKTGAMGEKEAISLMMVLYYAPWAIFCTMAGWLADRYSKRDALVLWKAIEVGVTLVCLAGFWVGRSGGLGAEAGPWVVASAVFGMGLHSAFFVPAKYGAMPEILQPHMLSRGNGILESLSFLAIIFGTVCGGVLSSAFVGREYIIGFILVALAVLGLLGSLLIRRMPAANPGRPFPPYIYRPLAANIGQMLRSRPIVLAIIGIAFFTFIVAFMRSTVYMYGESQAPRWSDADVSYVVGMVAVGIGVGSPLVGYLSGGKVEVGLVPIGSIGMAVAAGVAAFLLWNVPGLIVCIVMIGLFTGFYLVPLYSLLQHRAPKKSKGDWVATSNFLNVTGAITATVLFWLLSQAAIWSGLAPALHQYDVVTGALGEVKGERDRPDYVEVGGQRVPPEGESAIIDPVRTSLKEGAPVKVARYELGGRTYYRVRPASEQAHPVEDKRNLPILLFLCVAVMTLLTFFALRTQLPDLFLRTLLWFRRQGRHGLEVAGMDHLPTSGPVILATNAANLDACLSVLSATDRTTRFILVRSPIDKPLGGLTRFLARRDSLAVVDGAAVDWDDLMRRADAALDRKEVIGVPLDAPYPPGWLERMFAHPGPDAPVVLPVRVDEMRAHRGRGRRIYLVADEPLKSGTTLEEARQAVERLSGELKEWEARKKKREPEMGVQAPPAPDSRVRSPGALLRSPEAGSQERRP
jgi:MFS family permease